MTRRIYCVQCAPAVRLHPEDHLNGIESRSRWIKVGRMPADHGITVYEGDKPPVHTPMAHCHCDLCNAIIAPGQHAKAVSTWRTTNEPEPEPWEYEYGAALEGANEA